jgi:hypothetical protein
VERVLSAGKMPKPQRKCVVCTKQRKMTETTVRDSNLDTCRLKKWVEG